MSNVQMGILAPVPKLARYLNFSLKAGAKLGNALRSLVGVADGEIVIVGIGPPAVIALGRRIRGLRIFPTGFGPGLVLPSISSALWCWLRGSDRGALVHVSRKVVATVSPAFNLETVIDGFKYDTGRDLTGYVDGTENPKGRKAFHAAIVQGQGAGLDGSSFVAVQQWVHDFDRFASMPGKEQDNSIGRRRSDNKELAEAPRSAHIKRIAQENFTPEALYPASLDALGGRHERRLELRRVRQVLRRLRSATETNGWGRGRHRRRAVPIHPSDLRQLFLVSTDARRKNRSAGARALSLPPRSVGQ